MAARGTLPTDPGVDMSVFHHEDKTFLFGLAFALANLVVTQAQTSDAHDRLLSIEPKSLINAEVKTLANVFAGAAGDAIAWPTIRPPALPDGEVDVFYAIRLEISGGSPPYATNIIKGSLPPGLSLDNNGMISGTPSQAKSASFTVRVTDKFGRLASKKLDIKILKLVNITTQHLKNGKPGKKYSAILKAEGGKKPFRWLMVSGNFPEGLSYESSAGEILGAPKKPGRYSFTFQVTDSLGGSSRKDLVLTIE